MTNLSDRELTQRFYEIYQDKGREGHYKPLKREELYIIITYQSWFEKQCGVVPPFYENLYKCRPILPQVERDMAFIRPQKTRKQIWKPNHDTKNMTPLRKPYEQ